MSSDHSSHSSSSSPADPRGWDFYTQIVFPSGEFIATDIGNKAKKMYYLPSLLSVIYLSAVLIYQIVSMYAAIASEKNAVFDLLSQYFRALTVVEIVIVVAVFYVLMLFLVPVSHAGVVYLLHEQHSGHKQSLVRSFGLGLSRFLELFELHNITGVFHLLSVLTFYAFLLRIFAFEYFWVITGFVGGYFLLASVAGMLFSYAPFHVIFHKKSPFQALNASAAQAITHLDITCKVYIYTFLMNLRAILVSISILLVPALVSWVIGFFHLTPTIGMTLMIIGALLAPFLLFLAHLSNVLDIFLTAMWYHAFRLSSPTPDTSASTGV